MSHPIDRETYATPRATDPEIHTKAPNPADFAETQATSRSYWIRNHIIALDEPASSAKFPQSPEPYDVVVIGTGISGASAVYHLACAAPDLKVAVLEARGICSGATGRNGGHIARPEVYGLEDMAKSLGLEEALRWRRQIVRNRDMTIAFIEESGVADKVDLRLNGSIAVFKDLADQEKFLSDTKFAKDHGYEPEGVYLTPDEVVKKANLPKAVVPYGAAYLERSGTIYPRKLVDQLLQAALKRMPNLDVHSYTPVTQVVCDNSGGRETYTVTTANKGSIRTRAVLHATNAYASHLVPSLVGKQGVFGFKAHMLGIEPTNKAAAQLAQGIGFESFFHWILQRPEGGPFLYGFADAEYHGYDDTVTIPSDHPARNVMHELIAKAFPDHFPDGCDPQRNVTYDWTGVQGFTMDGASFVGRPVAEKKGEFVSAAFQGEGMTKCFSCSSVVVEAVLAYLKGDEKWSPPDWFPQSFRKNI